MRENLKDVYFILIVKFDSIERLENTLFTIEYLHQHFDTNILVCEIALCNSGILKKNLPKDIKYEYIEDYDPILHRTYYINLMVKEIKSNVVSIWDVDVIAPVNQIIEAVNAIRSGFDFAYPYKDYFLDTSQEIRKICIENKDTSILHKYKQFMNNLYQPNPVGGAFFANRSSYINSGLENEGFYGWGIEDGERYTRWKSKKMKIKQIQGPIFHLSHPRGINSDITTPDDTIIKKRILYNSIRGKKWKSI